MKIPKMAIGGEFIIDQDGKEIYTKDGEILIKAKAFGEDRRWMSTSPIELLIEDSSSANGFRDESYIVTNFEGIATVPFGEQGGNTDERYSDSIYFQKASTENRLNYLDKAIFKDITGKELIYFHDKDKYAGEEEMPPKHIKRLLDFYETLPEENQERVQSIKFYEVERRLSGKIDVSEEFRELLKKAGITKDEHGGLYDGRDGSIHLLMSDNDIDKFRHETAHLYHDFRAFDVEELPSIIRTRWDETLKEHDALTNTLAKSLGYESGKSFSYEVEDLNEEQLEWDRKLNELRPYFPLQITIANEFNKEWIKIAGGSEAYGDKYLKTGEEEKVLLEWKGFSASSANKGFIRPYGATEYTEDVATFIQKITSDPGFFKREGLFREGANPAYKEKIKLLKENGFITDEEYDAVLHPENYGLE